RAAAAAAAAQATQPAPQPELFDAPRQQPTFKPMAEAEEAVDDVPPPAYRPQPAASQPAPQSRSFAAHDSDEGSFVAPRRTAGQPSPEAMARLQAAVTKNPATSQRPQPQAAAPRAAAPAPAPARAAEKPRFGIGSLINRMAGHAAEPAPAPEPRQAPRAQAQQAPAYDDEPELSADQERIEIPAFLRRQAN
ncbi:MAG TPA: cell division protein FtsZ, partial [Gemmobacter sp.]|nr:cell division protein FtsZ [Gemmobacter sp.]